MLVAIAVLFFLPLAAAWWLYVNVEQLPEDEVVAHGELVRPARPLGPFELAGAAGHEPVSDRTLAGRWTVVFVGPADCDDACVETLWEARQVQARLGRESIRIQRLYLLTGADEPADPGFLAREHGDLQVARLADDAALMRAFTVDGERPEGMLFLVDPLGNLMMRYPDDAPPEALLDDLKRLLRVSRIG